MTDGLDEFFKGNEQPEAEIETPVTETQPEAAAAEPVAQEPKGPDRDEKGRFKPKGETEAAPPAAEEPQTAPIKALQDERRKRQELEHQLAELSAKLNPPQPAPDMWEDTQGWQQHFAEQVRSEATQAAALNARLDMSEMMARQAHEDFEDKKAAFLELMQEVPGLQQKALADAHPWNFAYQYVTNKQRMDELAATNVSELEAKLREQIKAELSAQPPAASPEIPTTLADAQSSRGSSGGTVAAKPLEEILGKAFRS